VTAVQDVPIRGGDVVVRGPDWKYDDQVCSLPFSLCLSFAHIA
jgi:hypothetical protein